TSFVLMILFIVLGTFAFFDPTHSKDKAELKRDKESHVFWLKDRLLESMKIKSGKTEVELECALKEGCPFNGQGDWLLTKPLKDKADPANVGGLAGGVFNLVQTDKIALEAGVDPKEFGFDHPVAELEFKLKGESASYSLKVGSAKSVGPTAYVETSSTPNTVFMVANYFPAMMQKDVFFWRNKRVFPEMTGDMVNRLKWAGANGAEISATKFPPGNEWILESPIKAAANTTMLEGLVTSLVYLDMKSVFSETQNTAEAKKILASKSAWKLSFQNKKGEWSFVTLFANPKAAKGAPEFIVLKPGEPRLLLIDGLVVERFNKPLIEYRDRRVITGPELSGASEITLRFPKEKKEITLKPDSQTWVYASGDKPAEVLSRDRIDSFLRVLSELEASSYLNTKISSDPAVAFFAKNPADLEIDFRAGGKVTRTMRFTVHGRREVLTESAVPDELAAVDGAFLKVLPVRFFDLYVSANVQVVTSQHGKETEHGEHSHADHTE
ncbi:MAG: DUF4340 domain-containing protein, partial [Bdellovibrionota bacterium]